MWFWRVFFSSCNQGDTLYFSSVGYYSSTYIVPLDIQGQYYSIKQNLEPDTMLINEVVLYPWPSKENFAKEFLALDPPITDVERAKRNLEINALLQVAMSMEDDIYAMQDYAIAVQNNAIYNQSMYYGSNGKQALFSQFLNPFAWVSFFEALKNGDLKLTR